MKTKLIILRDSRSGMFYDKNLGGFAQADPNKATIIEGDAIAAFVNTHFNHPEFIEAVPAPATALQSELEAMLAEGSGKIVQARSVGTVRTCDTKPIEEILTDNICLTKLGSFKPVNATVDEILTHFDHAGVSVCAMTGSGYTIQAWECPVGPNRTFRIYTHRPIQEKPATRADTLAEIGRALSEVIVSSGPGEISSKLSTIRKVIGDLEALTRKEQEKADAATDSLLDGGRALQMLIEYIGTEDHPPADLVEVLQGIQDTIIEVITWAVLTYPPRQTLVPAEEFAAISEEEPATSVIPPDAAECHPITNEGEPAPPQDSHCLRSIGHEAYLDWHRWHHYHDAYAGTPQRQHPDDNCKLCGEWDHDTEECEHQYY